jgi:site-specific DNA recombinase
VTTRARRREPVASIQPAVVRCAIYTRVSTDEGLGQDFNSLHNQREACEPYVASQRANGWELILDHYDDGGFSGATMDRPALKRLLADVEAGKVQRIVVYKMDRLTRSLMDFSRLADLLERHAASIVSVTQQFDTGNSMGRLTLNMLLSFAQFEREMIAERTQHKMAATRRKGKWAGGTPPLGYDVVESRLAINPAEAERVRAIFRLYLEHEAILAVVQAVNARGWRTKSWTTKDGKPNTGVRFEKGRIHRILTNWHYLGKVNYKDKIYDGEHQPIIDEGTWNRVQQILERNRLNGGAHQRTKLGALLSGLLVCGACGAAMIHQPSGTKNGKVHRYYRCRTAAAQGRDACPTGFVPAAELERFVVDRIRDLGKDSSVVAATLEATGRELQAQRPALEDERAAILADLGAKNEEIRRLVRLVAAGDGAAEAVAPELADRQYAIRLGETRLREVQVELAGLEAATVDEGDLRQALGLFDPVWDALLPRERVRVLHLLLECVDYRNGKLGLTFRPAGIRTLAAETREAADDE